jgi:hypothetical protein
MYDTSCTGSSSTPIYNCPDAKRALGKLLAPYKAAIARAPRQSPEAKVVDAVPHLGGSR